jgi:methylated-DNA-[protein]-cysteine S-methyltransferase
LGIVELTGTEEAVLSAQFFGREVIETSEWTPALAAAVRELGEYFAGKRTDFKVPLRPAGTAFQREVWDALVRIPFGSTASYGEIARSIGRPLAVRAVGAANGANPIAIFIPCHRVIGGSGSLVGYGGGLWRKEWLLTHERRRTDPARELLTRRAWEKP